MRPEDKDAAYLWDILKAAQLVRRFIQHKALSEYLRDEMMQAAVERKIEVIG
jgi:uncharacterized protein with HEPN domain